MWNIIGQKAAVELLSRSLSGGHLSHAYLITGPRHVGKMTLAINLAQAVNCTSDNVPCGECESCVRISTGKNADISIIDLSSESAEIGIKQVKEMEHSASIKPYESKCRIFIINESERLSTEASNSLLKTLEEPPADVIIVLLVNKPESLLSTILSRCQRIDLYPVSVSFVEKVLIEQYNTDQEKARLLARFSNGLIGWAISASRDESIISKRSGYLDNLVGLIKATLNKRFDFAARYAILFSKDRDLVYQVLNLCISLWRDLLLIKANSIHDIVNIDRAEELRHIADQLSVKEIVGFIKNIDRACSQLEQNVNSRLVLEVLMLKMPSPVVKDQIQVRM